MMQAIYIKDGESFTESEISKIPKILEQKPKILWIDISLENNELKDEEVSLLTDCFNFHELSVEDCILPQYQPKVEEFEGYIFVAIHGIKGGLKEFLEGEKSFFELDIFIGKDYIITVHPVEFTVLESIFEKAKVKPQIELKSLEILLYRIFEKISSGFEITLEKLTDRIDEIEDKVLKNPSPELMDEIFSTKKICLNLKKIIEQQINVYIYFTREISGVVTKKSTAYFRDIFFQFNRINQSIDSYNQVIGSILDVYLSGLTLKLTRMMNFLTVIATLFLPAFFITSYYGMNVQFPEYKIFGNKYVWHFVFVLIVFSTLGFFLYLRKKR